MTDSDRMHEVWLVQASTPKSVVARFRRLKHAEQYVAEHKLEGPFDIKMPNGRWHGRNRTAPAEDIAAFLASQGLDEVAPSSQR